MTRLEHQPSGYTDHEVVDDHHVKVGRITDVIYDATPDAPRWAIIKMHAIGREHIAPLEGAYISDDDRVVLGHDRATVREAPTAPHDHVLTRELEAEVARHYGLAEAS